MNLSFPDSTYSSSNKPSTATLKSDLQTVETDFNAHVADATIHFLASTMWPVGSIYISVVSTNPATLLGFGTWSSFAAGRTLVGLDSGQTEFDTVEETGGEKTHTLTEAELPVHHHTIFAQLGTSPGQNRRSETGSGNYSGTGAETGNTSDVGSGSAHNNLQPYIVTYMWKRTA